MPRPCRDHGIAALPLTALLLAAALLVPTFPLWAGRAFPIWDAATFYAPAWILVADAARQGQLLLWDLWVSGGRPALADPQIGALSPVVLATGAVFGGSVRGFVAYWLGLWLAAAVGTAVLARHLGSPFWGSLVAGAGILGSGFLVVHAQHTAFVATFAYLPWVLWRLDVALQGRRRLPAAEAGALLGLSAVGGYPALVFVSGLFVAGWTLARASCGWEARPELARPELGRPTPWRIARTALLVALLAGVVLAPTYAAFAVEGRGFSDRVAPLPRDQAIGENAMHPAALATFFAPRLTLAPVHQSEVWGLSGFSMASCYVGAGTVVLALAALGGRPRSAWRWSLAGLAVLFLAIALGPILPLRGWLYDWVPPTRYFRHAGVFRGVALLAIALLAADGARDRLELGAGAWGRRVIAASVGAATLAMVVLVAVRGSSPLFATLLPRADLAATVGVWLLPAAVVAGCGWLGRPGRIPPLLAALTLIDASTAIWRCRSFVFEPGATATAGWARPWADRLRDPGGARLEQTGRGLDRAAISRFGSNPDNRGSIAREAVLTSYDPYSSRLFAGFFHTPALAAVASGPQRIWFSPVAASEPADRATLRLLGRRTVEIGAPVLLVHPEAGQRVPHAVPRRRLPPMTRLPVELVEYRPERLRFRVDAPADGWLWVTDRWASGWRVEVDGETQTVWKGGLVFRAVEVPAGRHEIDFAYRPFGHPWLFAASLAALLGVALPSLLGAGAWARRRSAR